MSRAAILRGLVQDAPVIAPSILKVDYGNLHREVQLLERGGATVLHLDVMDGHFVPNLSYGPAVIESWRKLTDLPFDAHLMISDPARYLDSYLAAGCDSLTVHIEAVPEPQRLLRDIRDAGRLAGIALNPGTPVERIRAVLEYCDIVLVMSVEPGFGGQKFMPIALEKLKELRSLLPPEVLLSVDGGIGPATIVNAAKAGATMFVAGSSIFDTPDYGAALRQLADTARSAVSPSARQ
ncbi:MAG: rpe [Planctomycetaceae bacterium]|nr:rpe [Planctomycetaceae bacterium]